MVVPKTASAAPARVLSVACHGAAGVLHNEVVQVMGVGWPAWRDFQPGVAQ